MVQHRRGLGSWGLGTGQEAPKFLEVMNEWVKLKVHPGAARYWKEKGFKVGLMFPYKDVPGEVFPSRGISPFLIHESDEREKTACLQTVVLAYSSG